MTQKCLQGEWKSAEDAFPVCILGSLTDALVLWSSLFGHCAEKSDRVCPRSKTCWRYFRCKCRSSIQVIPPQNSPTIVNKTTLLICRRLLGQESKTMRFEGPLFLPMFATDRLFPSTGNLELKLFFNSSDFVLMGSSTEAFPPCKLQIERLELKLKRIQLSETAHNNVNSILQRDAGFSTPY